MSSEFIEVNGFKAWHNSLFDVFVRFFGLVTL